MTFEQRKSFWAEGKTVTEASMEVAWPVPGATQRGGSGGVVGCEVRQAMEVACGRAGKPQPWPWLFL